MNTGDRFLEWLVDNFLSYAVIGLLVITVITCIGMGIVFLTEEKKPTFELTKADWTCMNYKTYTTTSMVMSGKVMVPIITTHHECIQWNHL